MSGTLQCRQLLKSFTTVMSPRHYFVEGLKAPGVGKWLQPWVIRSASSLKSVVLGSWIQNVTIWYPIKPLTQVQKDLIFFPSQHQVWLNPSFKCSFKLSLFFFLTPNVTLSQLICLAHSILVDFNLLIMVNTNGTPDL